MSLAIIVCVEASFSQIQAHIVISMSIATYISKIKKILLQRSIAKNWFFYIAVHCKIIIFLIVNVTIVSLLHPSKTMIINAIKLTDVYVVINKIPAKITKF